MEDAEYHAADLIVAALAAAQHLVGRTHALEVARQAIAQCFPEAAEDSEDERGPPADPAQVAWADKLFERYVAQTLGKSEDR